MLPQHRHWPPSRDYPADEWNVIEKDFHPEFLAQRIALSSPATPAAAAILRIPSVAEGPGSPDTVVADLVEQRRDARPAGVPR
jgi:hypothetical protein